MLHRNRWLLLVVILGIVIRVQDQNWITMLLRPLDVRSLCAVIKRIVNNQSATNSKWKTTCRYDSTVKITALVTCESTGQHARRQLREWGSSSSRSLSNRSRRKWTIAAHCLADKINAIQCHALRQVGGQTYRNVDPLQTTLVLKHVINIFVDHLSASTINVCLSVEIQSCMYRLHYAIPIGTS